MPSQFKTPTTFPDFDKLRYVAYFDEGTVVVKRMQGNVRRGQWRFEFQGDATWLCVNCQPPWVKDNPNVLYSPEFIPESVILKAKEFITAELAIIPRPKKVSQAKKSN